MDGQQFDALTRALARATSRRTVLKGLAGSLAGLVGLAGRGADARALPTAANGVACTRATDCGSRFCVDGVCCNRPCSGQCEACNLGGASGICSIIVGTPVGRRARCPGAGACGGTCDGLRGDRCVFPGNETRCGEPECDQGFQTTYACGGNGTCAPTTTSCGLYLCGDGGCLTGCVTDDECIGQAYCADGVCQGDLGLGGKCAEDDECQSGLCVDGVCCNGPCAGECEACNLAGSLGFCANMSNGAACAGGTCCTGACLTTDTDAANCGACDHACAAPAHATGICANGRCGFACTSGYHRCGDACAADDSPTQCGSSCTDCTADPPAHTAPTCDAGLCSFPCDTAGGASPCREVCCAGGQTCCAGVCRPAAGASCQVNDDCCSGACVGNICQATCSEEGGACDDAADCCRQMDCVGAGLCCTSGVACGGACCASSRAVCDQDACCLPDDQATTCAGKCGLVANNCGQPVDCAVTCPSGQTCQNNVCRCAAGTTLCNGNCVAGCVGGQALGADCQCACPSNQILCRGTCVAGSCCTAADCPAVPCQEATCCTASAIICREAHLPFHGCDYNPITDCCLTDDDCHPRDACDITSCDTGTGTCVHTPKTCTGCHACSVNDGTCSFDECRFANPCQRCAGSACVADTSLNHVFELCDESNEFCYNGDCVTCLANGLECRDDGDCCSRGCAVNPNGQIGSFICACGASGFAACTENRECCNNCCNAAGFCALFSEDLFNCGACGVRVPAGGICDGGHPTCTLGFHNDNGRCCPVGGSNCGSYCANKNIDPLNCGACGRHCDILHPVCASGRCCTIIGTDCR